MERTRFRFVVAGQEYRYLGYLSAADALLIKQHAGLSILSLFAGIMTGDPAALVAMVFLAKRQAGERATWDEVVELLDGENDLMALVETLVPLAAGDVAPAEKVEQEQAPPMSPPRKTRATKTEPAEDAA